MCTMAYFDAELQYRLLYNVVPAVCLSVVLAKIASSYSFRGKITAWLMNKALGRLHRKSYFLKQKHELFKGLPSLQQGRSTSESSMDILEIGMGSGLNFKHYPAGANVTGLDPNPHHEYYIRKNVAEAPGVYFAGFIKSYAENMPEAADSSFDAVVCTLTLCSVRKPVHVLNEVHRVLKPGGQFFFLEHVAGRQGTCIRKVQNKLNRVWSALSDGCKINQETWTFFEESHFKKADITKFSTNTWLMFFLRPFMYGIATKQSK